MMALDTQVIFPVEFSDQKIAIFLLYIYKEIGERAKRRVYHQAQKLKTRDIRLPRELYERLSLMEKVERRMLLGGNNNTARDLSTWWKHCLRNQRKPRSKRQPSLKQALSKVLLPSKEGLDL